MGVVAKGVCCCKPNPARAAANTSASNNFVFAVDIIDVADTLGATTFHLIGHSMVGLAPCAVSLLLTRAPREGGIVAGLVAGAVPNRVLSLIMIDTIGAPLFVLCLASQAPLRSRGHQA